MADAQQPTDFYQIDDLLNSTERELRDRVRRVGEQEVLPIANEYWERAEFDPRLVAAYKNMGLAGVSTTSVGEPELTAVGEGVLMMELARIDGSLATLHGVHTSLAMGTIDLLGSDEQRQRWLPAMKSLEHLGAMALTEPDHGSDVVSMGTTAHRDGDQWVLNGAKRWIGSGSVAHVVVVWARDDNGDVGAFVVEDAQERDGWEAAVITGKIANRGLWQADITMTDIRIGADSRLAQARSFEDTNSLLAKSRQGVAWEAVGHAVGAYEAALAYARQREQFGRLLASFQLIQDTLAHMVTDITTMQVLCARMSQLEDEGRCSIEHAAMAKMHCAATARRVCAQARDLLGGNGILLENHVARHFADIEAPYTYEGTNSVQSLLIGRAITGLNAFT